MSTVAVGSLWQNKSHPVSMVKVIHTFDYAELDKEKERYIIFERFSRSPKTDFGHGVHVLSKSKFIEKYERPPVLIPEDTP